MPFRPSAPSAPPPRHPHRPGPPAGARGPVGASGRPYHPPSAAAPSHTHPLSTWVRLRLAKPDRRDEVRVLGLKGANRFHLIRLEIRQRALSTTAIRGAPSATTGTSLAHEKLPSDFTGLTAEQIAAGRKAVGQHGIISPEKVWQGLGFRPTAELSKLVQHPVAAFHGHQQKIKEQAALAKQGITPPGMSIGIIPFGKLGRAAVKAPEGEAAGLVRKSLPAARRLRAEQAKLYNAERAARIGKAQAAEQEAGGGIAGHQAALKELRGELPKTTFENLRQGNLGQDQLDALVRQVQGHPELRPYERITAQRALLDAFERGRTPAKHEIKLLTTVFGKDIVKPLAHVSLIKKLGQHALDVLNVPRAVMSSTDVSFGGRQGFVMAAAYPRLFGPNWLRQFKSLVSEKQYQSFLTDLKGHPLYDQAMESRLPLTKLGDVGEIGQREEFFPSQMAERIPVAGRVVRASGRAFTQQGDANRMATFEHVISKAIRKGVNVEDRKFLRDTARFAGVITGRGGLWKAEPAGPILNTAFFAPRLVASRVAMLNPFWYASLHPFVRREAAKAAIRAAAAGALGLAGLSQVAGATVGFNPLSADFAKAKFGKTRVDVYAGFQQYVRLAAQLYKGKIVSSTTGRTLTLGPGYGKLTREDVLKRFAVGKFNPTASFVDDFFKGTDFQGHPFEWKREALQRMVPLVAQDTYDLYHNSKSVPFASLGYVTAALGVGMQTYGSQVDARAAKKLTQATARQNTHLANLVRQGELPRNQLKRLRQALDIYDKRNQINTTIDAATKDKPLTRERQKFAALMHLLQEHKVLDAKTARHWLHYTMSHQELTPKDIQKARSWFWRDSGIEGAITWYRDKAGAND